MKMKRLIGLLVFGLSTLPANAQTDSRSGNGPPAQAYEACIGKKAGERIQHVTPEGRIPATCVDAPGGLAARPDAVRDRPPRGDQPRESARRYSIEQATSDRAQLNTIAFSGLAFLTGSFGLDTFLPPGKVSDYFGFQYLRDIDIHEGGHNTAFLTRIAHNMLALLDDAQRGKLIALAREQQADIQRFAQLRLPLIKAFRRNLEGDLPRGAKGLDKAAVMAYSADIYELDGRLAYRRAQVMGEVLGSLSATQKSALGRLKFGDSASWPDVAAPIDKRSLPHDVDVALMTYASEMFSWAAGSLDSDTYFCPERHGMYFGGFGLKTAPAMGKRNFSISTALTGDKGEAFLAILNDSQRKLIVDLITLQRPDLNQIVSVRRAIAGELRRFLEGGSADRDKVLVLSRRYGELDGELSYFYASAFAQVARTLSPAQRDKLAALRGGDPAAPAGPFLYSTPVAMPPLGDSDFLFGTPRRTGPTKRP